MVRNSIVTKIEIVKQPKDNISRWAIFLSFISVILTCLAVYFSAKSTDIAHLALNDQRKKDSAQVIENNKKDFRDSSKFERQLNQEKDLAIKNLETFSKQNDLIEKQRYLYQKQVLLTKNQLDISEKDVKIQKNGGYFRLLKMCQNVSKIVGFLGNDSTKTVNAFLNGNNRVAFYNSIKEILLNEVGNKSIYGNDTLIFYFNKLIGITERGLRFEQYDNSSLILDNFWASIKNLNFSVIIIDELIDLRENSISNNIEYKVGNGGGMRIRFNDDSIIKTLSDERHRRFYQK